MKPSKLLVCILGVAAACSAASLTISPSSKVVHQGDTFEMDVIVSADSNESIFGYQFDVNFTPGLLSIIDVQPGDGLQDASVFSPGATDNTAGTLSGVSTILGASAPASTSVRLTFSALAQGLAAIDIVNELALDSDINFLPTVTTGADVVIGPPPEGAPEPSSMVLSITAVAAVWSKRAMARRRT